MPYNNYLISTSNLKSNKDWFIVGKVPLKYLNKETTEIAAYLITIVAICIVLTLILTALITRSIYMPLDKLTRFMHEAKNGNFTMDIKDDSSDEIGQLTMNFKKMLENIRELIKDVNSIIVKVSKDADFVAKSSELSYSTSGNIAEVIGTIAQGAAEQAGQAGIGVENITKLSNGISSVGDKMLNVSRSVANTRDLSQSSLHTSELLSEKAKLTSTASRNIINNIEELTDYMKQIKNILKIIVNISEQTNLISINASIEAAKAGKTATGFAVVATEIKKLARTSKTSVASISELLKTIEAKADSAINEANNSYEIIDRQMEAVNETSKAFRVISREMEEIFAHVNNVDTSLSEVLEFKEEAIENIKRIAQVSQEAAATSEEVTAATQEQIAQAQELSNFAHSLHELSQKLMKSISNFKV
ncbi:MAG: Methyl-accepting chemotaxis protein McpC [Firmicutes bacterium ADurb.Bin419]|nr:MAG: Methyl-accepting chemotaxis protein McpC [Firmicutes bacterium ADurb.Bin419]